MPKWIKRFFSYWFPLLIAALALGAGAISLYRRQWSQALYNFALGIAWIAIFSGERVQDIQKEIIDLQDSIVEKQKEVISRLQSHLGNQSQIGTGKAGNA